MRGGAKDERRLRDEDEADARGEQNAELAPVEALAQEAGTDGAAEQRAPFEDGEAVGKGEEDEGEVEADAGHRADEAA